MIRRLARYEISAELIGSFFTNGSRHDYFIAQGIPPDAQFRGFHIDNDKNLLVLYFEHESFLQVGEGAEIPRLEISVIACKSHRFTPLGVKIKENENGPERPY